MKKTLILFCFLFFSVVLLAQKAEQEKIDSVCQLVKKYWAEKNADKIYDMAGDEFRKKTRLADFKSICDEKLFPLGEMKTTFEGFTNGVNKYKAVFTTDSLNFYLNLDSN